MPETHRCPQCGTAIRPDAPEGLCPECLLKEAMKSGSDLGQEPGVTGTYSPGSLPPSLEELAKQFPQLEILELLGQGGMGIVYKARQPRLDRLVALKILPSEAGRDPAFAERFAREARALAKLTHPSIVTIYDFGESDGRFYLLMEFVDGVNLRHLLRDRRLKPEEALKIVPQVCEALQYAHDQGVIHRDIKPENILLDKKGNVKIADFGLAKLLGPKAADSALTGSQQIMGTPHYMAPEQMERPLAVDHRADIYSLGVVFYEMLTGELPLGRFAPPSQKVQVDVRLDEVVLRALEKEPERRYQHASDVKTEVESITTGTPATASNASPQGVPDQVLFKRVTVLTLIGLAVWNVVLAALNLGYIARAEWYFRKELPYEWLQTLWWVSTLVCLGFGSWWYYLLVKRPGIPRSLQDYWRVCRTLDDPRLRPAWKPVSIWFGILFTAMIYVLWRFGFEENIPFLWVVQAGFGLTPFVLMVVLWFVLRTTSSHRQAVLPIPHANAVKVEAESSTHTASQAQRPAVSTHQRQALDAEAEQLERLVLPFLPENKIAAIKAYREKTGASLAEAKAAVEMIARRHGIPPGSAPLAAHILALFICLLGIAVIVQPFFPFAELQVLTLQSINEHRTTGAPLAQVFGYESTFTIGVGLLFAFLFVLLLGTGAIHSRHLWRSLLLILTGMASITLLFWAIRSSGYDAQSTDDFRERDTASGQYGFVVLGERLTVRYTWPEKFQVWGKTTIVPDLPGGMGPPPGLTKVTIKPPLYMMTGLCFGLVLLGALQVRTGERLRHQSEPAPTPDPLRFKMQSLWQSVLSLCAGSRVKGASSRSTDANSNAAHLSGVALAAEESVSHNASRPAMIPEADPVGGSPIMPENPTSHSAPALPPEQAPGANHFTMKVAKAFLLIVLACCLFLFLSLSASSSAKGHRIQVGFPSPWFEAEGSPTGFNHHVNLISWSWAIAALGALSCYLYGAIRRREAAKLSALEKLGSRGCLLWLLIVLFAFTAASSMAILMMTQERSINQKETTATPVSSRGGAAKKDMERIQGTWVAVSAEASGRELPEPEVKRIAMTFQGDKVMVKGLKKNDEEEEGTFRLDPAQKPKWFDLAVANKRISGIYMLETGSLRICFNQNDAGERPKTFATDRETEWSLIVLKRQRP